MSFSFRKYNPNTYRTSISIKFIATQTHADFFFPLSLSLSLLSFVFFMFNFRFLSIFYLQQTIKLWSLRLLLAILYSVTFHNIMEMHEKKNLKWKNNKKVPKQITWGKKIVSVFIKLHWWICVFLRETKKR